MGGCGVSSSLQISSKYMIFIIYYYILLFLKSTILQTHVTARYNNYVHLCNHLLMTY